LGRKVIRLEGVDALVRELERLNDRLDAPEEQTEPPKKEGGGWIWFLIGALLGLGFGG
jgi:hypothetical protein